jgi:hypothetical protein
MATDRLRRYRRSAGFVMAMPLVGGVGGVLIGTSAVGDVLGIVLLAVAAWCLVTFIRAQRQLAAAMSEWFGIRITGGGTPRMNPKRFDTWCQEHGLHPAPKLRHDESIKWSRPGSVASSRAWFSGKLRVAGTLSITSERVMFVPEKLGGIVIAMPKIEQAPVRDVVSIVASGPHPSSNEARVESGVSFGFRDGGNISVAIGDADKALSELRAILDLPEALENPESVPCAPSA